MILNDRDLFEGPFDLPPEILVPVKAERTATRISLCAASRNSLLLFSMSSPWRDSSRPSRGGGAATLVILGT